MVRKLTKREADKAFVAIDELKRFGIITRTEEFRKFRKVRRMTVGV